MDNIYIINNEKFKSIYFSINYTTNANKKEMSENAMLASILLEINIVSNILFNLFNIFWLSSQMTKFNIKNLLTNKK